MVLHLWLQGITEELNVTKFKKKKEKKDISDKKNSNNISWI